MEAVLDVRFGCLSCKDVPLGGVAVTATPWAVLLCRYQDEQTLPYPVSRFEGVRLFDRYEYLLIPV